MAPAYSVIIPARNAAEFIASSIVSVQQQTRPPAEVIVVDDGSTDATATLAAAATARVISSPGGSSGPAASRNAGVRASTTPVIAFLDADDQWRPTHAESLLTAMEAQGAVFAGSDAEVFGTHTGVLSFDLPTDRSLDLRDRLVEENPVLQSSVMIRRDAFDAAGGYDESMRYSEDYELWSRVAEYGRYAYVPQSTLLRRVHEAQASRQVDDILRGAWGVRRRILARRLSAGTGITQMLPMLVTAAHADIDTGIWFGDPALLAAVREELRLTDAEFALGGEIAGIGGDGIPTRRLAQDLRCRGRSLVRWIRN